MRDVTDERALRRDLGYRASHDELTGLANTRAWDESLAAEGDRRRAPADGIAVTFVDLDDFKSINDRTPATSCLRGVGGTASTAAPGTAAAC
jgi:GGDEF domain-containing protein